MVKLNKDTLYRVCLLILLMLLLTFLILDWEVINKDRHLKALSVYMEAAHAARLFKTFLFF